MRKANRLRRKKDWHVLREYVPGKCGIDRLSKPPRSGRPENDRLHTHSCSEPNDLRLSLLLIAPDGRLHVRNFNYERGDCDVLSFLTRSLEMSRTDHHRSYWIADEYRANHHWKCLVGRDECSLPESQIRLTNRKLYWIRRHTSCYWEPLHERAWWQPGPPKWYLDHRWNNPERVRVRDTGRKIIAEYRATGDSETEIANYQHRHSGCWYWC